MLGLNFLWHFLKVDLGCKNMIEIKKSPMASFSGLPRERSHICYHSTLKVATKDYVFMTFHIFLKNGFLAARLVARNFTRAVGYANRPLSPLHDIAVARHRGWPTSPPSDIAHTLHRCYKPSWLSHLQYMITDMGPFPWQALKTCHGAFFDFNHVFTPQIKF